MEFMQCNSDAFKQMLLDKWNAIVEKEATRTFPFIEFFMFCALCIMVINRRRLSSNDEYRVRDEDGVLIRHNRSRHMSNTNYTDNSNNSSNNIFSSLPSQPLSQQINTNRNNSSNNSPNNNNNILAMTMNYMMLSRNVLLQANDFSLQCCRVRNNNKNTASGINVGRRRSSRNKLSSSISNSKLNLLKLSKSQNALTTNTAVADTQTASNTTAILTDINTSKNRFTLLSDDTMFKIIAYLAMKELLTWSAVSYDINMYLHSDVVWKHLWLKKFGTMWKSPEMRELCRLRHIVWDPSFNNCSSSSGSSVNGSGSRNKRNKNNNVTVDVDTISTNISYNNSIGNEITINIDSNTTSTSSSNSSNTMGNNNSNISSPVTTTATTTPAAAASINTDPSQGWMQFYLEFESCWLDWLLAGFSTEERCLIGLHGCILDITAFLSQHPGSPETLLCYAGGDATALFNDMGHSTFARSLLKHLVYWSPIMTVTTTTIANAPVVTELSSSSTSPTATTTNNSNVAVATTATTDDDNIVTAAIVADNIVPNTSNDTNNNANTVTTGANSTATTSANTSSTTPTTSTSTTTTTTTATTAAEVLLEGSQSYLSRPNSSTTGWHRFQEFMSKKQKLLLRYEELYATDMFASSISSVLNNVGSNIGNISGSHNNTVSQNHSLFIDRNSDYNNYSNNNTTDNSNNINTGISRANIQNGSVSLTSLSLTQKLDYFLSVVANMRGNNTNNDENIRNNNNSNIQLNSEIVNTNDANNNSNTDMSNAGDGAYHNDHMSSPLSSSVSVSSATGSATPAPATNQSQQLQSQQQLPPPLSSPIQRYQLVPGITGYQSSSCPCATNNTSSSNNNNSRSMNSSNNNNINTTTTSPTTAPTTTPSSLRHTGQPRVIFDPLQCQWQCWWTCCGQVHVCYTD